MGPESHQVSSSGTIDVPPAAIQPQTGQPRTVGMARKQEERVLGRESYTAAAGDSGYRK